MRQTLFRILLDRPWAWWGTDPETELLSVGSCWIWIFAGLLFLSWSAWRGGRDAIKQWQGPAKWLAGLVALNVAAPFLPDSVPVFGYGAMVLIGFLSGLGFATARARAVGVDPEIIMDVAFWILLAGIAGGRTAYLLQYGEYVFGNATTFPEQLFAAVNLANGGLVLVGALVGGTLGFLAFCYQRKISWMALIDLIIPAVFIGIGFGRIGCLLNGCCFGDQCDLPWAITFPNGSVTFSVLVERGFVDPDAAATIPLHPTQIYSAINGFVLFIVTATFYWYRSRPGQVFALAAILYPITRILLEMLRADEMGQLGTGLTISQIYSLVILTFGVGLLLYTSRQPKTTYEGAALSKPA